MPTYITMNNINYFLFATVIHMNNTRMINYGHYITLLYDTKNYYIYDDMSDENISSFKIEKRKISEYQEKNGIMYFYYVIPK